MQSGDIKQFPKEKEPFDLGPLWSVNPDLTLEDFKNCVIDEKSIDYLMIAIKNNMTQRFAIYGKLKKEDGKHSVFYVFFQPSTNSTATPDEIKKLEEIFQGKIVQATRAMTGIVHPQTKAIRIDETEVTDPELSKFLDTAVPEYEVGLSCYYNHRKYPNVFSFMNRSTMNYSSCELNEAGAQTFFFIPMHFDKTTCEFHTRIFSRSVHLDRSVMFEIEEIIKNTMALAIKQRLLELRLEEKKSCTLLKSLGIIANTESINTLLLKRSLWAVADDINRTDTQYYTKLWENHYRYNKTQFALSLEETIFVAAGLRSDEKPSGPWTQLSDTEIITKTLKIAEEHDINLNLNRTDYSSIKTQPSFKPLSEKDTNRVTTLMLTCRKGPLSLVAQLIDYNCDIFQEDINGHNALWYAKEHKKTAIIDYLEQKINEKLKILYNLFKEMVKEYMYNRTKIPNHRKTVLENIDNLYQNLLKEKRADNYLILLDYMQKMALSAQTSHLSQFFRKKPNSSLFIRLNNLIDHFVKEANIEQQACHDKYREYTQSAYN